MRRRCSRFGASITADGARRVRRRSSMWCNGEGVPSLLSPKMRPAFGSGWRGPMVQGWVYWVVGPATCAGNRSSAPSEHMPSTKDFSHRTTVNISQKSSHNVYSTFRMAPTLTRLRLHSRQPFLDFLWPFLVAGSPILIGGDLTGD